MLSLSCLAAITKLGTAKISCQTFFSMVPEITGRFMDMLLDFVTISEAYQSLKDIGLRREFLCHFGPRVTTVRSVDDQKFINEMKFWIDLTQRKLQRAISREKIWSRLTTCESIEVSTLSCMPVKIFYRSLKRPIKVIGYIGIYKRSYTFIYCRFWKRIWRSLDFLLLWEEVHSLICLQMDSQLQMIH